MGEGPTTRERVTIVRLKTEFRSVPLSLDHSKHELESQTAPKLTRIAAHRSPNPKVETNPNCVCRGLAMNVNNPPQEEQQVKAESKEKQDVDFDPSRMIGIIKRKALIKDLAAAYHAECVAYCRELLQLQKKWEEQYSERRIRDDTRKQVMRPSKRQKKGLQK